MAKLIVEQGKDEGEMFTFEPPIKFGRDEDNDFTVNDPRVSRIHGRVSRDGDAYYIEDLGSSNGTHVNGISTSRSQIVHGDLIQVGDTELVFEVEEPEMDQDLDAVDPAQDVEDVETGNADETGDGSDMSTSGLWNLLKLLAVLIFIAALGYLSYYLVGMII